MNLTALYHFELPKAWLIEDFLLRPLGKAGNNTVFNDLFTTPDLIKVKDIGPIPEICGDYQARRLQFLTLDGKTREIVFQGNTQLLDKNGIVGVKDYKKDCYLYSVVAPNTFEVYISEGNGRLTQYLLMMLCDGYLDHEIKLLRKRIYG